MLSIHNVHEPYMHEHAYTHVYIYTCIIASAYIRTHTNTQTDTKLFPKYSQSIPTSKLKKKMIGEILH